MFLMKRKFFKNLIRRNFQKLSKNSDLGTTVERGVTLPFLGHRGARVRRPILGDRGARMRRD